MCAPRALQHLFQQLFWHLEHVAHSASRKGIKRFSHSAVTLHSQCDGCAARNLADSPPPHVAPPRAGPRWNHVLAMGNSLYQCFPRTMCCCLSLNPPRKGQHFFLLSVHWAFWYSELHTRRPLVCVHLFSRFLLSTQISRQPTIWQQLNGSIRVEVVKKHQEGDFTHSRLRERLKNHTGVFLAAIPLVAMSGVT